ncbi:MAG: hypothetical protein HYU36_01770 [Planctomycetes bacterium]|nr:hypothetical protein [Planctomycetota bacterium]
MSLTISIRFLTGRAHLHHWQAHHSDGKLDWPPSPWRLLRSLVAVAGRGLSSLPWPPHQDEMAVVVPGTETVSRAGIPKPAQAKIDWNKTTRRLRLVELLTDDEVNQYRTANTWPGFSAALDELQARARQQLPTPVCDIPGDDIGLGALANLLASLADAADIWLPRSSHGHTRQYFPIHEEGIVKPSGVPVFDTFAVVDKYLPIHFQWPDLELSESDPKLNDLRRILARMTYFGRAESWCEAKAHVGLKLEEGPHASHWKCVCTGEIGQGSTTCDDRIFIIERKLAPLPIHAERFRNEVLEFLPRVTLRLAREAFRQMLSAEANETLLLRCLLRESSADIANDLDRPIGTRWVHYAVPRTVYDVPRPRRQPRCRTTETVDLVCYALNTATVNRPVLPALTDTLLVADKFRAAAIAIHEKVVDRNGLQHPRNLCGHEENGDPCQGHQHAFFWPTDEDNDGFIDHVTVYCPGEFEQTEVDALRRLFRIRQRGGRPDLLVTPVFWGKAEEFEPWKGGAIAFVSATPYFCPVHLSHGRSGGGKIRPITREIIKGLLEQNLIASQSEVEAMEELVFDYAPKELASVRGAVASGRIAEPVAPRQYFPVVGPTADFPPLPRVGTAAYPEGYDGAWVIDPDQPDAPFGVSSGLLVDRGTRLIRALGFCRRRRGAQVKGRGRMLRITFQQPRRSRRPFAIGDQCHFGLGLFVPVEISRIGRESTNQPSISQRQKL